MLTWHKYLHFKERFFLKINHNAKNIFIMVFFYITDSALFGTLRLCICVFHTRLLKHILYVIPQIFLSSFTHDCGFFLFLNLKLSRSILLLPIINGNIGEDTLLPSSEQYMYIMPISGHWTLLHWWREFVRLLATQSIWVLESTILNSE